METQARIILLGGERPEFRRAAQIAGGLGAEVRLAATPADALDALRLVGADLVMIEVSLDVAQFAAALRRERIAVPLLACGVNASAERAVAAVRAGAYDYIPLPPDRDLIAAALLSIGRRPTRWIAFDPVVQRCAEVAMALAPSPLPVLIEGESGTGKLLLARRIHQASGRTGPLVLAECAGLSPAMLASELFGHEELAFEGAVAARAGKIAEARSGTLVLRHIDAVPASLQARLVECAGLDQTRLIATSCLDLAQQVGTGRFRFDLLARLTRLTIQLPALRDRIGDIEPLASAFAETTAQDMGMRRPRFEPAALERMAAFDWPGNVRDLQQLVERAVLVSEGGLIGPRQLLLDSGAILPPPGLEAREVVPRNITSLVGRRVDEIERELIIQTLHRCGGNRTSASSILGISVRTMRNKLRTFIDAGYQVPAA